ncbi:uncharacterized protein BYT42DRAFT_617559 [Radiomyces spectabilis]|uniref:uncharacterized protein n=1 Tax=Radiomyces spectabilis TaxID=64574 RepID=UPI00221FA6F0|nr:uncharacterized protein BYT42DRAFT_617559 [Radiomyces spectabilis]KAI8369552.1 hypothetical protein BYT42DRAFT_617559 [Radiomyces spectabilis]
MAFRFNWPEFDQEFYHEAKSQLESALNKGEKPKKIVDTIAVKELHMGTMPPELEILEIGELTTDKFRGIFKLTYAGDAYIVLQTKVQANPMHTQREDGFRHTRPGILAADHPLIVPMLLRISDLKLRGIVVLVVSKTKGITLVFKNDPLESINISSTFDNVPSVREFLQCEIEKQLRNLFQEQLPVIIHNLSLRHIHQEEEKQRIASIQSCPKRSFSDVHSTASHRLSVLSSHADYGHQDASDILSVASGDLPPLSVYSQSITPSSSTSTSPMTPYMLDDDSIFGIPVDENDGMSAQPIFNDKAYFRRSVDYPPVESYFDPAAMDDAVRERRSKYCLSTRSRFPVTAANLSTLNYHYTHRYPFMMMKTGHRFDCLLYKNYASIGSMHRRLHSHDTASSFDETLSEQSFAQSSNVSLAAYEIYADDADAPWYATEAPELPSITSALQQQQCLYLSLDDPIHLHPHQNTMVAKLTQLASAQRTLSPLTSIVPHTACRSLPHTVKNPSLCKLKHKKVPKRRIIRLSVSTPTI